jgi:hypothetical protein
MTTGVEVRSKLGSTLYILIPKATAIDNHLAGEEVICTYFGIV